MKSPQEQANQRVNGSPAGILAALPLFICIILIACFSWYKSVNPKATPGDLLKELTGFANAAEKEAQPLYDFGFDTSLRPGFTIYGNYLAQCGIDGVRLLDKGGRTVFSESIPLNSPIIKTAGSGLMVADIGATDLLAIRERSVRWRNRLDSTILNADLSSGGYVAAITTSKRYNGEIRVFDTYGVELFRKIIAEDYPVSARIAPSGRTLVVSGINAGAYGAYSTYKFYDFKGNEPEVRTFEKTGELLPLFWFNNDSSLFAAGDRAIAVMDETGSILWEKRFTSIAGACPAGDKRLAVALEDGGGMRLEIYDVNGKETASGRLGYKPRGVTAIKGAVAVYTDDTVYFYNDRCELTGRYSPGSQIRQTFFFNRHQAAIVAGDAITVVDIS